MSKPADRGLIGHNSIKYSRPFHHSLVAWLSERRRLLWATLEAGHTGTANGVRTDSEFCVTTFPATLETRDLPHIIIARLTPLVRKVVIHRIPEADWRLVARGIAVGDLTTQSQPGRGSSADLYACAKP